MTTTTTTTTPIARLDLWCDHGNDVSQILQASSDNSLLGPLESQNPELAQCDPQRNGIIALSPFALLETKSTIASLRGHFLEKSATGLTVEAWITPASYSNDEASQSMPILTIGRHEEEVNTPDLVGCSGYELFLAQRGDLLEISYADNDPVQSCRILLVRPRPLVANELLQVTLVLSQG
jgi:hypothetical protein